MLSPISVQKEFQPEHRQMALFCSYKLENQEKQASSIADLIRDELSMSLSVCGTIDKKEDRFNTTRSINP